MGDGTTIEWTDATVNVVNGCSVLSAGCTNCYAMRLAGTRLRNHPSRAGLTIDTKAGPVWNGTTKLNERELLRPLAWKRPRRIFWNAHGDLFHESVPDEWIDRCFGVMALTPGHKHQVLTKRAERLRAYFADPRTRYRIARAIVDMLIQKQVRFDEQTWPVISEGDAENPSDILIRWPLPNVWLGVSVEDQRAADERIPHLLATPAAVRFLSCEPLLGAVNLEQSWHGENALSSDCWGECNWCRQRFGDFPPLWNCQEGRQGAAEAEKMRSGVDWVIAGGESGPGARPMHPDWVRSLRDQCVAAGVPFFFKQWGEWLDHETACDVVGEDHPAIGDGQRRLSGRRGDLAVIDDVTMIRVGKRAAGRLLDGVEHNGMPA